MSTNGAGLNPGGLIAMAFGFWPAKILLSAVDMGVFTLLAKGPRTKAELGAAFGFHPRGIADYFDALVALRLLEREGDGEGALYRNTAETGQFLDAESPDYIGGIFVMFNRRVFGFWNHLEEGLRTGKPQNEVKYTGRSIFAELYSDAGKLEEFLGAMRGFSRTNFRLLAEKFPFGEYQTLCDVGGATGLLCEEAARHHPHLQCISFDLPPVAPVAEKYLAAAGLTERVKTASGDFFADPLPKADVITMGMILHDWNLENKMHLLRAAYAALPPHGALVVIETIIDDARRTNAMGLMMSLQMLLEFGEAFDYSAADFAGWCREVGFQRFEVIPLAGPSSAVVAYKQ